MFIGVPPTKLYIILAAFSFPNVESETKVSSYDVCPSKRLHGDIIGSVPTRSKLYCSQQCSQRDECLGANYFKQEGNSYCELVNITGLGDACADYPVDPQSTALIMKRPHTGTSQPDVNTCDPVTECPLGNGFTLNTTTGVCYKIITSSRYWTAANMSCAADGTHLMRFRNVDDWTMINGVLLAIPALVSAGRLWIDGNDLEVTGVWRDSAGNVLPWTIWQDGEPTGGPEHYLNLMGYSNRDFKMNDQTEDYSLAYICQYC